MDSVILQEQSNEEVLWTVAKLAMQCVKPRDEDRPSMQKVVSELQKAVVLHKPRKIAAGDATSPP